MKKLPKVGAIVETEEGEGIVDSVEVIKEQIKVKFKDGEEYFYKKYNANDIKIIKNISNNRIDPEEAEHLKELKELENLQKMDNKNNLDDI